jgi:hypothetical protein
MGRWFKRVKKRKRAPYSWERRQAFWPKPSPINSFLFGRKHGRCGTKAWALAREGDIVLLAPACSSFDMFEDYDHRGRVFKAAVEDLSNG